jgi:uncharacterized protein (DUF1697 family)
MIHRSVPPARDRGIGDIPKVAPMARHIALLRGINVGSNHRIGMAELRELLAANGFEDPRTLLASGNVVLGSRKRPATVARELNALIRERFGFDIGIVVRSRDELAAVVADNPLGDVDGEPKNLHVVFLSGTPDAAEAERLAAAVTDPERLVVRGSEIYVWYANGMQGSPAAKLLTDARLGVIPTARNWNTVLKLLELADAP